MCRTFSGIITKDKTYFGWENDSHESLIKEAKLDDSTKNPEFVRVEFVPKDDDIFNHDPKNWELVVDQDFRPEWFSEKFAYSEMRKQWEKIISERFIINRKIDEIKNGRFWVGKGGEVGAVCSGGSVNEVRAGGSVNEVRAGGSVNVVRAGGSVNEVWGSVKLYDKNATYKTIKENGMVILYYKDNPEIIVANKKIKLVVKGE